MNLATLFNWSKPTAEDELPAIFPISITQNFFVETDLIGIYSKILTETLDRTHGLTDEQVALMWDNCVKSNSSDGLITLLSKAMADKRDLFVVYDSAVGVVRKATSEEEQTIRKDYETQAESSTGIFISFKNFRRSDMLKVYLGLEYCAIASLNKSMNLSRAVQLKMNDLRSSVSLSDAADVKAQAVTIARALANGRDVMLDAKDLIETLKPDLTATKESVEFISKKISFYLNLPAAWVTGEQTGGLGTTGENDTRAIERGLKGYFLSIIKPTLEALFGVTVSYKSQDMRQIAGSMEIVKTFSLIDDSLISAENKRKIINQALDLPENAEGDPAPKALPAPAAGPQPPARVPAPAATA